jgi:hypothetical protein
VPRPYQRSPSTVKNRHGGGILDPLGDEERRPFTQRVRQNAAAEAERRQRRHQFIVEIGAQRRCALGLLACARNRNATPEIGEETAVVKMAVRPGNGCCAAHRTAARGNSVSTSRAQ